MLILYFLQTLLAAEAICQNFEYFLNSPTKDDAGFVATFTNRGIKNFADAGLILGQSFLEHVVFPDIHHSFDLGITSVDLSLLGMRVDDFSIDNFTVLINADGEKNQMNIQGLDIQLSFGYKIKQNTVPYLTDEGVGVIRVGRIHAFDNGVVNISSKCPYHKYLLLTDATIQIGTLDIKLNSPLGDTINFLIVLLNEPLKLFFETTFAFILNQKLSETIEQMFYIEQTSKTSFQSLVENATAPVSRLFFVDCRAVDFIATNGYITIKYPGQMYFVVVDPKNQSHVVDPSTIDLQEGPVGPLPDVVNNADVQYIIDRSAFNSAFHTWHHYNSSYDSILHSNTTDNAVAYLSIDSLSTAFVGIENMTSDNIAIIITHRKAPYVRFVVPAGMYTEMDMDLIIKIDDKPLATVHAVIGAIGTPDMFTYVARDDLNMSSFYLTFLYGNSTIEVSNVAEGITVNEENLEIYIGSLYEDVIGIVVSESSKMRSLFSENTMFMNTSSHVVSYYPPEYCAVTINFVAQ